MQFSTRVRPIILLFVLVLSVGCSQIPFAENETFYSYREVGLCNGKYVGEAHTTTKIDRCYSLLTSKLLINISPNNQFVTLIEESLGLNMKPEVIHATAISLRDCRVVDRENFSCEGLERREGAFSSTASIGYRRISASKMARFYAEFLGKPKGFISESTLNNFESWWMSAIVYTVIALMILGAFVS